MADKYTGIKKKIGMRKSPLGYAEYTVPEEMWPKQDVKAAAITQGNASRYQSEYADNPETTTHERIHIGQQQLKNWVDPQAVVDTIPPVVRRNMPNGAVTMMGQARDEFPAYAFSQDAQELQDNAPDQLHYPVQEQQKSFNDYMTLLHQTNPDSAFNVEAAMPKGLMSRYLATTPMPVPYRVPEPPPVDQSGQALQARTLPPGEFFTMLKNLFLGRRLQQVPGSQSQ